MVRPRPLERCRLLAHRGRAGLAWEVLRRDPGYRAAAGALRGASPDHAAPPSFAARWGGHFR
ncbi:transcriptional regulator domain-containing protein [Novosphingobium resinovorum]|uniref:transcriptional regulator domain-containing protein n=1 Tax=Novosphingobium resinovorum TaxID=158500 RepID=UPI003AF3A2BE